MQHYFSEILAPNAILSSPSDLAHYGRDWAFDFEAKPSLVLLPSTEEQIVSIIKVCNREKIAIVPSGGRTGMSAGATATKGEVILSLERLNKILEVDQTQRTLRTQAGVITQKVQDEAQKYGLYFPVDFPSRGSSQIGGNVATNAGGIRVVRYGILREWILGLRVVTATGEVLELNGALVKNQTGYDLRTLFIGSEGTLGIITEVTLKLTNIPLSRSIVVCGILALDRILDTLTKVRADFSSLSAFEFITHNGVAEVVKHHTLSFPFKSEYPYYLVLEFQTGNEIEALQQSLMPLLEQSFVDDIVVSTNQKHSDDLMALRERVAETLSTHHVPHKNDISVPIPKIPEFVEELFALYKKNYTGVEVVMYGHLGDGNLHIDVLKPRDQSMPDFLKHCKEADKEIFEMVQRYRGSISAEHGVGLLKKEYLHFSRSPEEISLMRQLKNVFDPQGILNPGKIFDARA